MKLNGNGIVAQSGGPTAVINNSLYGLIQEAQAHREIQNLYGALWGAEGLLSGQLIDLRKESQKTLKGLSYTPSVALGSSRRKIRTAEDYSRLLNIFKKNNIRYFFYIGGNDSMDTVNKVNKLAIDNNYEIRAIGIPKTIDNDIPVTDHAPGYGSAAKFIATTVMETGLDLSFMATKSKIVILEVMGRNAGWLAGAAALAKNFEEDAPHLIYLPEVVFNIDNFIKEIKRVYKHYGRAYIVVSEGIKNNDGNYICSENKQDDFGHFQLGSGLAHYLKEIIELETGINARYSILGILQRSAMHCASGTDALEAYMLGREAVKIAINGITDAMVGLERQKSAEYQCDIVPIDIDQVANKEKLMPDAYINPEGTFVTKDFIDYVRPLIQGEVIIPMQNGLPKYVKLFSAKLKQFQYRL